MFSVSKNSSILPMSSNLRRKKSKFFLQIKYSAAFWIMLFNDFLQKYFTETFFSITKKRKLKVSLQYHCAFLLLVQSVTRYKVGVYTRCLNYMRWFLLWKSTIYKQLKTRLISKWTNTERRYSSNWDKVGTRIKSRNGSDHINQLNECLALSQSKNTVSLTKFGQNSTFVVQISEQNLSACQSQQYSACWILT